MPFELARVVTSVGKDGRELPPSIESLQVKKWTGADAGDAVVWSTSEVPVDNSLDELGRPRKVGTTIDGGSIFRVTELGPGFTTPMHRTLSIDYCMLLEGELQAIAEGGEAISLEAGDVVIQRGAPHAWRNPSTTTRTRFVVMMIDADPTQVRGKTAYATPEWKIFLAALSAKIRPLRAQLRARPTEFTGPLLVNMFQNADGRVHVSSGIPRPSSTGQAPSYFWTTQALPVDNTRGADGVFDDSSRATALGSSSMIQTIAPGETVRPLARGLLGYALVVKGSLELVNATGPATPMPAGTALVQRGTGQSWRNPSTTTACEVFVTSIASRSAEPSQVRTTSHTTTEKS